jgi:hypothetical protein
MQNMSWHFLVRIYCKNVPFDLESVFVCAGDVSLLDRIYNIKTSFKCLEGGWSRNVNRDKYVFMSHQTNSKYKAG